MSLFSSFIVEPVVRQARRFSGTTSQPSGGARDSLSLSHVNANASSPDAPHPHTYPRRQHEADTDAPDSDSTAAHADSDVLTVAESLAEGEDGHTSTVMQQTPARPSNADEVHVAPPPPPSRRANTAPVAVPMSSNPATLASQFRLLDVDAPSPTTPASLGPQNSASPAQHAPTMSESLPADDGMRHLRARIHQIRELPLPEEEKARMMHQLMTERWSVLRPTSPSSFISHDRPSTPTSGRSVFSDFQVYSPASAASEVDAENPFQLRPGDTEPTYRSPPAQDNPEIANEDDEDNFEGGPVLGCQHYKRNVKVQCFQCRRWYTCRHCHDAVEDHNLNRVMTQNMLCMACGTPQKAGEHCINCGTQAACYYCDICKLWDNNSAKKIYHCVDCGICRRGAGLGKDYIHCKV